MSTDITATIRKRVKEIRLKKGVSQGKLARALGIHPTYVSQIERGIRNPTIKNIEKLARALGVSPDKLLR
ncbi:MAG: helix-turn-helix transcriptional regulator [Patescibacteria group bacterium]